MQTPHPVKTGRLLLFAAVSCLTAALCASCGRTAEIEAPRPSASSDAALSQADNRSDTSEENLFRFSLALGGETFHFPAGYGEFADAGFRMDKAGEEIYEEKVLAPYESCGDIVFSGRDVSFRAFFYNDTESSVLLSECRIFGAAVDESMLSAEGEAALPKGIRLGRSTYEEIETAYGPANNVYHPDGLIQLSYEYDSGQNILLNIDSGTKLLCGIDLHNFPGKHAQHPTLQAADSPEPYAAPAALGDFLLSGSFQLDDKLCRLPAPVSVLTKDGWTPEAAVSHMAEDNRLDALTTEVLTLKKGEAKIHVSVANYSEQAAALEDCLVTRITCSSAAFEGHTLTLPGGIGLGSKKKEVNAALKDLPFSFSRGLASTCYTLSDPATGISLEIAADKDQKRVEWIELNARPVP